MLSNDDCDECVSGRGRSSLLSHAVFLTTFCVAYFLATKKLLPQLSAEAARSPKHRDDDIRLPTHNLESKDRKPGRWSLAAGVSTKRIVYTIFGVDIGLSAVLVELLLCEISNALESSARTFAINLTLPVLTFLIVVVAPALELQSVLAATGLTFAAAKKKRVRAAWVVELAGLMVWLFGFWYSGSWVLDLYFRSGEVAVSQGLIEGCVERVGVTGVGLMAILSGFAAVSTVWQTLLVKKRKITDSEMIRRQTSIDALQDMLDTKRSRLRAVEHKMADVSSRGVFETVVGTLRGTGDSKERSALVMEINGLETMRQSQQDAFYLAKSHKEEQERNKKPSGAVLRASTYAFALYCLLRIFTVGYNNLHRALLSRLGMQTSSSTDPVTNILSILVNHWDPSLDRSVWTRQISFILSGVLLTAAFNSAIQTFLIFAKAFPALAASAAAFRDATTLALLIGQVVAAYVISAALMLRSSLPEDVRGVVARAIGTPLQSTKIDAWFDAWFLGAALLTMLGLWVGNRFKSHEDLDGFVDTMDQGKMS